MRKFKSILLLSASLVLILSLSFTAIAAPATIDDWKADWKNISSDYAKIALTPGADETEMNFAWVTFLSEKEPGFKYGRSADLSDAVDAEIAVESTPYLFKNYKVTLSGLTPGTWYYSYVSDNIWQEPQAFEVYDPAGGFQVMFCSDSQIGRSGDAYLDEVLINDSFGWNATLEAVKTVAPNLSFILSGGDQVETAVSKKQYNTLLAPEAMKSLPIATTIGNHECYSPMYNYHFNNPNNVKDGTIALGGYPYYFAYGDVLFVVLNSNAPIKDDQEAVLNAAVKAYPNAKWRVAMLHHSIYSVADSDDSGNNIYRSAFAPLFDKYDFDLALSGHDHIYGRTFPLTGGVATEGGVVYMAAGSASGSKMSHTSNHPYYIENTYDFQGASFSTLDFTGSSINIKTYKSDNLECVDEFSIEKDTSAAPEIPEYNQSSFFKMIKDYIRKLIDFIMSKIPLFRDYNPVL